MQLSTLRFFFSGIVLKLRRPKFFLISRLCPLEHFSCDILDVGIANNSLSEWFSVFPATRSYTGIDLNTDPATIPSSLHSKIKLINYDLNSRNISELYPLKFDLICAAHVLEHTNESYQVLHDLISLLRNGGYIYIEYPNLRSLKNTFLSSYNFYGDNTHVFPPDTHLLLDVCRVNRLRVVDYGTALAPVKFLFSLFFSIYNLCMFKPGWRDHLLYIDRKVDYLIAKRE